MTPETLTFLSEGTTCEAWHFAGSHDDLATRAGRPVVVMAHGMAGTKDSGLAPFAEAFAAAGLDVIAFDYRGFGGSEGQPRQSVSVRAQVVDYLAALDTAAALPGVDPARLVLWGVSLAGGHVLEAAALRSDVAAVVALTPLVDGLAAGRLALRHHRPAQLLRSTGNGLRSRIGSAVGADPIMIPVVAPPGERGAFTLPGALEDYLSIAGPSWRNEIDASVVMELGKARVGSSARQVRCPVLVQIGDLDRSAPPQAAAKVAFAARAQVRRYPCDHFDVWPGKEWHQPAVTHAVHFLQRRLAPVPTFAR